MTRHTIWKFCNLLWNLQTGIIQNYQKTRLSTNTWWISRHISLRFFFFYLDHSQRVKFFHWSAELSLDPGIRIERNSEEKSWEENNAITDLSEAKSKSPVNRPQPCESIMRMSIPPAPNKNTTRFEISLPCLKKEKNWENKKPSFYLPFYY